MHSISSLLVAVLFLTTQFNLSRCQDEKLYDLFYKDINPQYFDYCVRLLNGTKQVGCQSTEAGNVGVLFHANTSSEIRTFFTKLSEGKLNYVLLVDAGFFNRNLLGMLKASNFVQGVILYQPDNFSPPIWSPDLQCPNERIDLYNETYGPKYGNCPVKWNAPGDALTEEDVPFPVFSIKDAGTRNELIDCYFKHNLPETYPLCAVQMKSFMSAAENSVTCLRRSHLQTNLEQIDTFCEIVGGHNLVGSLKLFEDSYQPKKESVILVTAARDTRSFFTSTNAPGANTATGFISLLGVVHALGSLEKSVKQGLEKNIVFVLLDGEAFENAGSTRMVYDMQNDNFPLAKSSSRTVPITLSHLSMVFELRQLGLVKNDNLYAHFDPISRQNSETNQSITEMIRILQSYTNLNIRNPSGDNGLPPSSLQSILKEHNLPGIVLTDYDNQFTNQRYFSQFDNLRNLGISVDRNATDQDVKNALENLAQNLTRVSTMVAKTLFHLASGPNITAPNSLQVNSTVVRDLLFCYLYKSNCSLFRENLDYHAYSTLVKQIGNFSLNRYVSVYRENVVFLITNITEGLFAHFIGEKLSRNSSCVPPKSHNGKLVYTYLRGKDGNPVCVVSSSYLSPAVNHYLNSNNISQYANYPGMWTESQWGLDAFRLRLFLIQKPLEQGMILFAGIVVQLLSFVIVYFIKNKTQDLLAPL